MKRTDGVEAATEARHVAVVVEPDAQSFVEQESLGRELVAALEIAKECLTGTTRIRVEFMEDPEEDDAPPSIVLEVDNSLPRAGFREARRRFYRGSRTKGYHELLDYLSIVRE